MRKPLLTGLVCELVLAALALAVLVVAIVLGAPALAVFAGIVTVALLYIAGGFLWEHFRPGCHYFDWVEWFVTVFCVEWTWNIFCKRWIWKILCKEWIWQTFCKKWIWQGICIDTLCRKIRKCSIWVYLCPAAVVFLAVAVWLLAYVAELEMFFWVVVYAACVICLVLDGLLVKKSDTGLGKPHKASKDQRLVCILMIAVLGVIAGLRNVGGTDYNIYYSIYNSVPKLGDFIRNYASLDDMYNTFGVERMYLFGNSFFKTLHFSYYGYIFVQALFIVFTIYFALRKYSSEFMLVVLVFLYKFYFYNVFISLRQPITIAIFFIMLKFMENRKIIPYMLLAVLAFSFHTAAIILFPLYFLNRLKLSRGLVLILNAVFIPTLVLSEMEVPMLRIFEPILNLDIFATDEVFNKAEHLILGESLSAINWLHTAEYFCLMVLLIMFFYQIREAHPGADTMIKLFLCLLPIFTLFRNYEILTRIKDYFTISYGFIISYLAAMQKGKYRFIAYTLTALWCGFGFLRFVILFDGGAMCEYIPNIFLGRSLFE